MMYPILCKVKFETLHLAFRHRDLWIQIGFSIVMNWLVAPFVMVSSAANINNLRSLIIYLVTVGSILGLSSRQVGASRWTYLGWFSALYCNGKNDPFHSPTFAG